MFMAITASVKKLFASSSIMVSQGVQGQQTKEVLRGRQYILNHLPDFTVLSLPVATLARCIEDMHLIWLLWIPRIELFQPAPLATSSQSPDSSQELLKYV